MGKKHWHDGYMGFMDKFERKVGKRVTPFRTIFPHDYWSHYPHDIKDMMQTVVHSIVTQQRDYYWYLNYQHDRQYFVHLDELVK